MSIRILLIIVGCMIWSATGQAAQGGGAAGGANYTCDGTTCTCDGTATDCLTMVHQCPGDPKATCKNGVCTCRMRGVAAEPAKPRPGTPARVNPPTNVK